METIKNQQLRSVQTVEIDDDSDARRLDNFLIGEIRGVPHSHIYSLIRTGQVRVNSKRAKAGQRLKAGDKVRIPPVRVTESDNTQPVSPILKAAMQNAVFEDEDLLVINKPAGVAVHAGTNHKLGLIEAIRRERAELRFIELVHRLDKHTSGILVLAKNKRLLRDLHSLWRRDDNSTDSLTKNYSALVMGKWKGRERDVVTADPAQSTDASNRKMASRAATSTFVPVRQYDGCTLMDITLHTGKTHQARQHALDTGHPIAGDQKYGDRRFNGMMRRHGLRRMFLHARKLSFRHPGTNKLISIETDLPEELSNVLINLQQKDSTS